MKILASNAYLVHCHNPHCRALVLSLDTRCPHCGYPRGDTTAFRATQWLLTRILLPAIAVLVATSLLVASLLWMQHQAERRAEAERALREGAFTGN